MKRINDPRAILAVDPAPFGLAYVFFEGGELRDWGRRFADRTDNGLLGSLSDLIQRFGADVLVIEDPAAPRNERRPRMRHILRKFRKTATDNGLEVIAISRWAVRTFWKKRHGFARKLEVAVALAADFPELGTLAPRPRKAWRSEDTRARLFDALTLVLFAFPSDSVSR